MAEFKSPKSRLARLFKKSRDAWKEKAAERQRRLRASQVRIRDLEQSRDHWKKRALEAEKALTEAGDTTTGREEEKRIAASPPAGHRYSAMVMQLAMGMVLDGCVGSRGVHRVLELLGTWFPVAAPACTTVLNWLYRCGLHVLNRAVERRTDWIFVADHTIALGQSKCLVVLGIAASELERAGFSPGHRDMRVLAVEVTSHSTGPWVAQVLEDVARRVGTPRRIVADHGSDLRKGIALYRQQAPQTIYTYDISHRIATLLKAELGEDERWNAFLAHCRNSLSSFQQTDLAFLPPPRQRTKARFMHVDARIEWAQRLLAYHDRGDFSAIRAEFMLSWPQWERLEQQHGPAAAYPLRALIGIRYPDEAAFRQALESSSGLCLDTLDKTFRHNADAGRRRFLESFGRVLDYRHDLAEQAQPIEHSKAIQSHLKSEGLHSGAREQLEARLGPLPESAPRAAKATARILEHVDEEAAKVPANTTWLASSDIIESVFGKYKSFTAKGPLKEIGKLVLAIPAFVSDPSTDLIREAMQTVRTVDVDNWAETHLGESMLAQRRKALKPLAAYTKTA